jgi:hypothetical protein
MHWNDRAVLAGGRRQAEKNVMLASDAAVVLIAPKSNFVAAQE